MKIPAITHRTWYSDHLSMEFPVLRAYVASVEDQIADLAIWRDKCEIVGLIEDANEGHYQEVAVAAGLDDTTYSLEAIFDEYFPQLQRQSALIVLYSFLERELGHLCDLFSSANKSLLPFSAGNSNGSLIADLYRYLRETVGLKMKADDAQWQEIDHGIRVVRNHIVHNSGRLPEIGSKDAKKIQNHVKKLSDANLISADQGSIVLGVGYLNHVLVSFEEFFEQINAAIADKST